MGISFLVTVMKSSSRPLLAPLFAFTLFVMSLAAGDFTINGFHSDISINKDSSFFVKEIIKVEFQKLRHGIYREIPFRYIDELGNTHITPMEFLSVTDISEKRWKTGIENRNNIVHIRIGDPET